MVLTVGLTVLNFIKSLLPICFQSIPMGLVNFFGVLGNAVAFPYPSSAILSIVVVFLCILSVNRDWKWKFVDTLVLSVAILKIVIHIVNGFAIVPLLRYIETGFFVLKEQDSIGDVFYYVYDIDILGTCMTFIPMVFVVFA